MITVLGSLNMDIVSRIDRYPAHGETRLGRSVDLLAGGKGANQAAACAKLGKKTALIGCVGADSFGDMLLRSLRESGVATDFVRIAEREPTGMAIVTVDDAAENTMIVVAGANDRLTAGDVDAAMALIRSSSVLLVQLEVPHKTVRYAMEQARKHGVYIILDPAPAEGASASLLAFADVITPNKQETKYFTGIEVVDEQSALEAAKTFEQLGVRQCVIKMAEQGSLVYKSGNATRIRGIPVRAVDTVGAGDSFAGALAAAMEEGADVVEAARFATAVSALKVTKAGAQHGLPSRAELESFCRERGIALYGKARDISS